MLNFNKWSHRNAEILYGSAGETIDYLYAFGSKAEKIVGGGGIKEQQNIPSKLKVNFLFVFIPYRRRGNQQSL